MAENKYKIISLRHLAQSAEIEPMKLYHNLMGRYSSLTDNEKTQLANALHDGLKEFSKFIGVEITVRKARTPKG